MRECCEFLKKAGEFLDRINKIKRIGRLGKHDGISKFYGINGIFVGLYKMPIKVEKIEAIPSLMPSIGLPVIRTEDRENGIYYFYETPNRSNGRLPINKYSAFWITHEKEGHPCFFMSGLSSSTTQIAQSLRKEGLIDDEGWARDRLHQRQLAESLLAKLAAKDRRDRKDV